MFHTPTINAIARAPATNHEGEGQVLSGSDDADRLGGREGEVQAHAAEVLDPLRAG